MNVFFQNLKEYFYLYNFLYIKKRLRIFLDALNLFIYLSTL